MPLIPQQDIVVVEDIGGSLTSAVEKLTTQLDGYPPCRIVSIAIKQSAVIYGIELVAVVETI